jgi:predicted Zn-dependent protease
MTDKQVTDPAIIAPVQAILDRLLEAAGPQPYQFKLRVIDDDTVNAFAVPGGGVVVLTGLLKKADNPDEVAGVLAHEIQHVLGRHSLRSIYQQVKWQLALAVLVGNDEGLKQILVSQTANLTQLSYGRDMETESDVKGAALLVKAGLSPRGLRDFFVHLQEEEGKHPQPMEFLSTHPTTSHRIETLERLAKEAGDKSPRPLQVDWKGLKKALSEGGKDKP